MKELRVTTARLGSDLKDMSNGGAYVNVAVSKWGQLDDGTYGNKTMWVTLYLNEAQKKYCEEKGIKKSTAVAFAGRFDYGLNTTEKGQYLTISVNPYYIVKAIGGLGGICTSSIDNVRLIEDIIINEDKNTGRAQAAYDAWVNGKPETRWITLFFNESLVKKAQGLKLKKNSHLDIEGEITIIQKSYNDKEYVNASLMIGSMGYAANAGKPAENSETATPTAPTAPEAPTAPTAPVAPTAPAAPTAAPTHNTPETPDDFHFAPGPAEDDFF